MFDAIRNSKKFVQVFLALIALTFAFWGVESYLKGSGPGNDVATVGESKITQQQFHESWREQMDRAAEAAGLAPEVRKILSSPACEVAVNFPVKMDDGRVELFSGYRVQHNNVLGPFKGGIR